MRLYYKPLRPTPTSSLWQLRTTITCSNIYAQKQAKTNSFLAIESFSSTPSKQVFFMSTHFTKDIHSFFLQNSTRALFLPKQLKLLLASSLISLLLFIDWSAFSQKLRFVFLNLRLDRHALIFRYILKFFTKTPFLSKNVQYASLKIKGKTSRKGISRTRKFFRSRSVILFNPEGLFKKKYFFVIVVQTGASCFLGFYSLKP